MKTQVLVPSCSTGTAGSVRRAWSDYLSSKDCPAWMNIGTALANAALVVWIWVKSPFGDPHATLAWFAYGCWSFEKNFMYWLDKMAAAEPSAADAVRLNRSDNA
jgi:hypothetical protein